MQFSGGACRRDHSGSIRRGHGEHQHEHLDVDGTNHHTSRTDIRRDADHRYSDGS